MYRTALMGVHFVWYSTADDVLGRLGLGKLGLGRLGVGRWEKVRVS